MKYLKLFKTETEYNQFKDSENYVLPNVNLISENNELIFNPNVEAASPNIICTYDVTDISRETRLTSEYVSSITTMIVDGVEMDFDNYYQFDSNGLHIVEFVVDDNTINVWEENNYATDYRMFSGCDTLICAELPEVFSNYEIYGELFAFCYNLVTVTFNSKIEPFGFISEMFDYITTNGVLRYPKGSDYSKLIAALPESWTYEEF